MTGFSFADHYKAAGLSPGPEIIKLREAAFQRLLKSLSVEHAIDAVRLYYGLPVQDLEWLRVELSEEDASFSLVDNHREIAVLAACILQAGAQAVNPVCSLGVLVGSVGGVRKPVVSPHLVGLMTDIFSKQAVSVRRLEAADMKKIRNPAASKGTAEAIAASANMDAAAVQKALKAVSQEGQDIARALAGQIVAAVGPLVDQVRDLREEADILWWLTGGWSRVLNVPFETLTPATAALMSGIEMGALAQTSWGPVAASELMHRMMMRSRKGKVAKQTFKEVIDAVGNEQLQLVQIEKSPGDMVDVFPVLGAIFKAKAIGVGAWHGSFDKAAHLTKSFAPTLEALGRQAYLESLLLKLT